MKWKWMVAGISAVAVLPVAVFGFLIAAFSVSNAVDDPCAATTSAVNSSLCVAPALQASSEPAADPDALVSDPTSNGRITERMLNTYLTAKRAFDGWPWGVACWSLHAWNPTSDHPRGRACDFTVGHIGQRPTADEHTQGWELAHWAQTNAPGLGISYVIWDGHIWSAARDKEGWRLYDGGGIYNPDSITGGHYDHVHISVELKVLPRGQRPSPNSQASRTSTLSMSLPRRLFNPNCVNSVGPRECAPRRQTGWVTSR